MRFALEIVSGKRVLLSSTKSIKDCALELLLRPIPYEHEFLSRSSSASDDHINCHRKHHCPGGGPGEAQLQLGMLRCLEIWGQMSPTGLGRVETFIGECQDR